MNLMPAHEDLLERTLQSVPTILAKLRFLSSIRLSRGEYQHWGLERRYGKEPAQNAIREAHTKIFLAELSMPLAELWQELSAVAESEGVARSEFAAALAALVEEAPAQLEGGSEEHHRYILRSLFLLAQTPGPSTHPAA